jgi:hypothetical protein
LILLRQLILQLQHYFNTKKPGPTDVRKCELVPRRATPYGADTPLLLILGPPRYFITTRIEGVDAMQKL